MDITTIVGIVACLIVVFFGIVTGADGFASLVHFKDLPSVFITLGGSIFCMMIQAKGFPEFINSFIGFANKGFKSDSLKTENSNISLDGVHGEARDTIAFISIFLYSLFSK